MISLKQNFNLPAFVLGGCVLCVIALNALTWQNNAALAEVARQKQETVTRLLVDR
jgi:hypothetical protein